MINSEQREELGKMWFSQLQKEIAIASPEGLEDFRDSINPDTMGPVGNEGISE